MSESERYLDYRRKKISLGADGNVLMALISINVVIFLMLIFIKIIYFITQSAAGEFESNVEPWFSLPASINALAHKPWTLLTYMFSHTGLILTLTNMLWLWVFGSIFQDMTGTRKLIPLYIYGGAIGAILFIASYYLIPPLKPSLNNASLMGANAAIMAIAVATTTLTPDFRFFRMINGGIPLWIIMVLYIIIDFAGIAGYQAAYSIAHLGGALTGFLFVVSMRKGRDCSLWMNQFYDWLMNLFNPAKKRLPIKKVKERIFYNAGNSKPFVKKSHITQQRIDELLDKINQKGYHSLSDEEKNILKQAAETDL